MFIRLNKMQETYVNVKKLIKISSDGQGQLCLTLEDGSKMFTTEITLEDLLKIVNK